MTNNETNTFEERFEEVGAIWKKDGDKLSISTKTPIKANENIICFPNKFVKDNPNAPHWRMYRGKE